jgi:hypothetical protein
LYIVVPAMSWKFEFFAYSPLYEGVEIRYYLHVSFIIFCLDLVFVNVKYNGSVNCPFCRHCCMKVVLIFGMKYMELLYELFIHRVGEAEVRQTQLQRAVTVWL